MVIEKDEFYRSRYTALMLFAFMLGAIMTMLYLPQVKDLSGMHDDLTIKIFALLLAVSGILAGSVCGLIILPCTCMIMGSAAAIEIDMISTVLAQGEFPEGLRTLLLLVVVPLHFMLCGCGMNKSAQLIRAMKACGHKPRDLLASYSIMFIGTLSSLLLLRYMINNI